MSTLSEKLGICVLCGDRVFSDEQFLKSQEGYIHYECITQNEIIRA